MTTAEANRRFYAEIADDYDQHEDCVVDERLRASLREVLALARAAIGRPRIEALDACGGSGNASLMLLEAGIRPVTVDVSPEMLALFERKAAAAGHQAQTVVAEIDGYLAAAPERWDLIVFSSALHHLDDPAAVLVQAVGALRPGGCIVSAFDPRVLSRPGRLLRKLDYALHLLVHRPRDAVAVVARRRRRGTAAVPADPHVGALAERHAMTGIDDDALVAAAVAAGCRVVAHPRRYGARFAVTRLLYRLMREPTSFSLVLQRAA